MKKTKIFAALLVLVLAFSLVALTACNGEAEVTYTGACSYENAWSAGKYYGAKVDVTLKGDKITAVTLYTDEQTGWTRTSNSWQANQNEGDLGYEAAEAAYADYLKNTFVGKTVAEIMAIEASATKEGQTVTTAGWALTGATQSSARIICALQDALANIK